MTSNYKHLNIWKKRKLVPATKSIVFRAFEELFIGSVLGLIKHEQLVKGLEDLREQVGAKLDQFALIEDVPTEDAERALCTVEECLCNWEMGLDELLHLPDHELPEALSRFMGWAEDTEELMYHGTHELMKLRAA